MHKVLNQLMIKLSKNVWDRQSVIGMLVYYSQIIVDFAFGFVKNFVKEILSIKNDKHKSACNNFRIGLFMLRSGNISDAMFRFWLADKFYRNSPINQYYMAYVYYRRGSISLAIKHLYICYSKRPSSYLRCRRMLKKMIAVYPDYFLKNIKLNTHLLQEN